MRTIKKTISVLLALMVIITSISALSFSVSAAETNGTITVTSNLSKPVSYDYDSDSEKVKVTYFFQSDYKLVDMQGYLEYDPSVLEFVSSDDNEAACLPGFVKGNTISNLVSSKGIFKFNATSLKLFDFTTKGVFFTAEFNVKKDGNGAAAIGNTVVNLNVEVISGTTAKTASEVKDAEDVQIVYHDSVNSNLFSFASEAEVTGGSNKVTINFALPRNAGKEKAWSGADLVYGATTNIAKANRLAMTKTNKVIPVTVSENLTTTESGNLDVYTVKLSEDEVAAIDAAKSVAFAAKDSTVRTGMRDSYSILKATTSGTYATAKKSIADFNGMTFAITDSYDANYENTTYIGKWFESAGETGYEINFAAPRGSTASKTWVGADVYYCAKTTAIADAVRIPMTKTREVIKSEPDSTTSFKSGEWSVYTVKLTEAQATAIDSSKVAGFVAKGATARTSGSKNNMTILNSTATSGNFTDTKSSIKSFVGKTFVIDSCYDVKYEASTYTGYWDTNGKYVATTTAKIYFAAPISDVATRDWTTGVDFCYGVTSGINDATRVPMTNTGKVIKAQSNLGTIKSGEWAVYSVDLTADQVNDIGSCLSVGFAKKDSIVRTGLRTSYSILKATETGEYVSDTALINDFDGKMFVIDGCYDSKYEASTYKGHWTDLSAVKDRTTSVTIKFAAPKGTATAATWNGVNLYYNTASSINGAKKIAMTKTSSTKAVTVNGLKTLTSGNWDIYQVTLTKDQIIAIDSSRVVGFANAASDDYRTNAGRYDRSVVNSTSTGYVEFSNSIIDYNGKTFVINDCYDSKYEAKTYLGVWS